jgi:chromosomal replication initiator protein
LFFRGKFRVGISHLNVPDRPLVTPLSEGSFALALSNGTTWASQFILGPEGALLRCALDDFLGRDTTPYQSLVLHGAAGLGKSHLAHGIARRFAAEHPALSVVCETGADFARGYATAVETHDILSWREAHRGAALLVIDNLDELAGKSAAQIEFLHTVDALAEAGGRLLVTARSIPTRLPHLLPGLVSRLSAGLTVALAKPGPAARSAALECISRAMDISVADDALRLLARELDVTMPELAGALHELTAPTNSPDSHEQVTRIDHDRAVAYLAGRPAAREVPLGDIAARTARHYALAVADLRGPSQRQNIARARAVAMFIARQLTDKSLGAVGKYFGGRDHTTVLHGCRKTEELMMRDAELRQTVHDLRAALCRD